VREDLSHLMQKLYLNNSLQPNPIDIIWS